MVQDKVLTYVPGTRRGRIFAKRFENLPSTVWLVLEMLLLLPAPAK